MVYENPHCHKAVGIFIMIWRKIRLIRRLCRLFGVYRRSLQFRGDVVKGGQLLTASVLILYFKYN